ncbi:hypothetical protein AAFP30_17715 [Gordonia sp. CPCC 205515]|uniref:hypothetical protein n=1 Tax=Gordonia sp. CPCC 205515 TaxID=3140791 RepID=UPI003AF39383
MNTQPEDDRESSVTSDSDGSPSSRADWRRKRKIDDVFGDDLPELTSDESDEGHSGLSRGWYESNRPPHYE